LEPIDPLVDDEASVLLLDDGDDGDEGDDGVDGGEKLVAGLGVLVGLENEVPVLKLP
jgi:hypothetical protein